LMAEAWPVFYNTMFSFIREIWVRRDLITVLVVKGIKIRYSRSAIGFLWIILAPLFFTGIFYVFFSVLLKVQIREAPFLAYLMSALFPWIFFHDSVISSVTSFMDFKNLIKESNFPHYFIPVSIIFTNAIYFLPSLAILIIVALFYLKGLPVFILLLPVIFALHLAVTAGISLTAAVLYVRWRDTKYIVGTLLPMLFYSLPVFYSIYLVKGSFKPLWFNIYINNPFVGIVNLYRLAILRGFYPMIKEEIGLFSLVVMPVCFAAVCLSLGLSFYQRNKNSINDYLSY
jgi:ABC-2 type transport system permease protein